MSRFPKAEAEVAALALRVVEGCAKAPEYFPNPPVPVADLKAKLDTYVAVPWRPGVRGANPARCNPRVKCEKSSWWRRGTPGWSSGGSRR